MFRRKTKGLMNMTYLGHQGDVCIFEVDEFPADAKLHQDKQCKDAILAYGELSGHAHQFTDVGAVNVFKPKNEKYGQLLFIEPKKRAFLEHGRARDFAGIEADHDYHKTVELHPGKKYVTGIVEETDWINKTIRKVVD